MRSDFKDNLKDARLLKRLTIEGLSKRSGISKRSISYYEAGFGNPSSKTLEKLAVALETNEGFLLKERV